MSDDMTLTPKNWDSFQHYKGRSPPWIKLHRSLLDDYDFSRLHIASRALAPLLWLLASEYEGGQISASLGEISFRLRISQDELKDAIRPLIHSGFFIASAALAECLQDACLEKEGEREIQVTRNKEEGESRAKARFVWPFDQFWAQYPHKVGKQHALIAFQKAERSGSVSFDDLMLGLMRYAAKTDDRPWCNPATWLNGHRWTDQPALPINGGSNGTKTAGDRARELAEQVRQRERAAGTGRQDDTFGGDRDGGADDRLLPAGARATH